VLAAIPQLVAAASRCGKMLAVARFAPTLDCKSFDGHPAKQSTHGYSELRSLSLQMPSPQEPQTPPTHLMPILPQLPSDRHSTHPFKVLLQYGVCP
jgi:hypothetical protein